MANEIMKMETNRMEVTRSDRMGMNGHARQKMSPRRKRISDVPSSVAVMVSIHIIRTNIM